MGESIILIVARTPNDYQQDKQYEHDCKGFSEEPIAAIGSTHVCFPDRKSVV